LSALFIPGVMATPSDVNITCITIEKVHPENIGIAVRILFLCVLETNTNFNIGFSSLLQLHVRFPAASIS